VYKEIKMMVTKHRVGSAHTNYLCCFWHIAVPVDSARNRLIVAMTHTIETAIQLGALQGFLVN
jgi:hypothetical protein